MNQIQITHSSNARNLELAQQLQTLNLGLRRLPTEVSHLRTSVVRNQSTQNRDAENLFPKLVTVFGDRSRLTDKPSAYKQQKLKQRNFQSLWEEAQKYRAPFFHFFIFTHVLIFTFFHFSCFFHFFFIFIFSFFSFFSFFPPRGLPWSHPAPSKNIAFSY